MATITCSTTLSDLYKILSQRYNISDTDVIDAIYTASVNDPNIGLILQYNTVVFNTGA